jgi:hypothetical protein
MDGGIGEFIEAYLKMQKSLPAGGQEKLKDKS